MSGYIKLHRKLLDWEWYRDATVKSVFLHLLLRAAFKNTKWQGIDIKAGQVIVGRKKLAEELGFTEQQIRTALKKLEKTGEINQQATNKYTLVTLLKWGLYQIEDNFFCDLQPTNNQQITNNQPHINNINNDNNAKKLRISRGACGAPPPTVDEINSFLKENGIKGVSAVLFHSYYSGRNWRTASGQPITDWQTLICRWQETERETPQENNFAAYDLDLFERMLNSD